MIYLAVTFHMRIPLFVKETSCSTNIMDTKPSHLENVTPSSILELNFLKKKPQGTPQYVFMDPDLGTCSPLVAKHVTRCSRSRVNLLNKIF